MWFVVLCVCWSCLYLGYAVGSPVPWSTRIRFFLFFLLFFSFFIDFPRGGTSERLYGVGVVSVNASDAGLCSHGSPVGFADLLAVSVKVYGSME